MAGLEAESARLGLDIETVVDRPPDRIGRLNLWTFFLTGVLALPTVLGRFVNLPPHELIGVLADRQKLNFRATFKILSALLFYPLWWVLVAVALVAMPLLGYLAARGYGRLRRFRNRRSVQAKAIGAEGESGLIVHRHHVLDATAAILAAGSSTHP